MIAPVSPCPDLSVIVTSYGSRALLERCLEALAGQRVAAIIVSDCSPDDPSPAIEARFPGVSVMHHDEVQTVPELRWRALARVESSVVAAIESRCVPEPGWCAELDRMHRLHPDSPAIGGPVRLGEPATPEVWGVYFCEYGMFAPSMPSGAVAQLSGANLSYKTAMLRQNRDLLDAGAWEEAIHARWRRSGRALWMSQATVVFQGGLSRSDALRMRFHYGRSYAAGRFADSRTPIRQRVIYALGAPALPPLLTWRIARNAQRRGLGARLRRALPWLVVLNTAWAAGEFTGYLLGRAARPRIV